ncbi:hypothetical protein FQN57_005431 [Myotisia sp. PD_48]|nr:hypothetical protein FQN57_005431 [Myotisia sp. PD_48]
MPQRKWEQTKDYSRRGLDKAWRTFDKLGRPVNRLSNKLGAEAFWPTTLDKECDKAARILRSFCKDGFYDSIDATQEESRGGEGRPRGKPRVIKKIPASVIRQAKGLAIFTTMRAGLWVSGAGGSGVLVARIPESGDWSPPSAISLHTAALGFLMGVDIYDCVIVINTYEALEAFKSTRCTLGGAMSAVAGPVGIGGGLETELHKRRAPVWSYLKSRGLYAGVQVNGTIVIERTDENERFYQETITVSDILGGKLNYRPSSIDPLMQTIKLAQGDSDVDENILPPPGDAPGDMEISLAGTFGVPDEDDPDPYGVRALEREGVMIREAATKRTPPHQAFEFRPSATSPISQRWSADGSRRSSWRNSGQSAVSTDRGTQTDDLFFERGRSGSSMSRGSSRSTKDMSSSHHAPSIDSDTEHSSCRDSDTMSQTQNENGVTTPDTQMAIPVKDHSVAHAVAPVSPTFSRAKLVTIPKRTPPMLPGRNPERVSSPLSTLAEARDAGGLFPGSTEEKDRTVGEQSTPPTSDEESSVEEKDRLVDEQRTPHALEKDNPLEGENRPVDEQLTPHVSKEEENPFEEKNKPVSQESISTTLEEEKARLDSHPTAEESTVLSPVSLHGNENGFNEEGSSATLDTGEPHISTLSEARETGLLSTGPIEETESEIIESDTTSTSSLEEKSVDKEAPQTPHQQHIEDTNGDLQTGWKEPWKETRPSVVVDGDELSPGSTPAPPPTKRMSGAFPEDDTNSR